MKVQHPSLPDFAPTLKEIMEITFNSGLKALRGKNLNHDDLPRSDQARRVFVRGCHYGYDKAQRRIGREVLFIENEIRGKERELKEFRKARAKGIDERIDLIRVLKDRQLTLRRIVDAILWTIIGEEQWIVRRLGSDETRAIDPKVLDRMLRTAAQYNEKSRYNFSLVSDLSTTIHHGDIFEAIWPPDSPRTWRLIELKEGRINTIIGGILGERTSPLGPEECGEIEKQLGKDAVQQAKRMLRQRENLNQLRQILSSDRGTDFRTKTDLMLTPDVAVVESYDETIEELLRDAEAGRFACTSIDQCLHLVAVKQESYFGRHHLVPIFHVLASDMCENKSPEALAKELDEMHKTAPFVDLVDLALRAPAAQPVFFWLRVSPKHQADLILGRFRLFGYFDIERFLSIVRAHGIKASWVTGTDAAKVRKISPRIPGSPNAYAVRFESHRVAHKAMNGFFSRIYLYLTKPSSLLRMVVNWDEQYEKMSRIHFSSDANVVSNEDDASADCRSDDGS